MRFSPADAAGSEHVYRNRELLALQVENAWLLRDALARFAAALADDGDAWVGAVTLADKMRGSLAELADVAGATVGLAA